MRKIEKEMLNAISTCKNFRKDNTSVSVLSSYPASSKTIEVKLHGHTIAIISDEDNFVTVDKNTLRNYPTVTTKSRLRALGVNVYTKNHVIYLNDEAI